MACGRLSSLSEKDSDLPHLTLHQIVLQFTIAISNTRPLCFKKGLFSYELFMSQHCLTRTSRTENSLKQSNQNNVVTWKSQKQSG